MASRGRWKRHEREVAEALGSKRNPCNGQHHTDVDAGPFAVEVKTRKSLPVLVTSALEQCTISCAEGQTPVVVLREARQGVKTTSIVCMWFEDFIEWFGELEKGEDHD